MSLLGGGVGVETDRPAGAGALFFIEIPLVRSSYKPPELNELRAISAQSLDGFGDIGITVKFFRIKWTLPDKYYTLLL